jgi:hypothetical protein
MAPYVVTGLVLRDEDPNTPEVVIPRLIDAVMRVVDDENVRVPGAIRTVGFFEFELTYPGATMADVARAMTSSSDS